MPPSSSGRNGPSSRSRRPSIRFLRAAAAVFWATALLGLGVLIVPRHRPTETGVSSASMADGTRSSEFGESAPPAGDHVSAIDRPPGEVMPGAPGSSAPSQSVQANERGPGEITTLQRALRLQDDLEARAELVAGQLAAELPAKAQEILVLRRIFTGTTFLREVQQRLDRWPTPISVELAAEMERLQACSEELDRLTRSLVPHPNLGR